MLTSTLERTEVVRISQQGVTMVRLAIGALEYARRKKDSKFLSRFHWLDMTWVYYTTVKSLFIEFIKKVSSMKHCEKLWKQSPTESINCNLFFVSGSSCWTCHGSLGGFDGRGQMIRNCLFPLVNPTHPHPKTSSN